MTWRLLWKLVGGFFVDLLIGSITGASLLFAVGFGLLETVFLEVLCPSLSFFQVQAVGVLVDETEHLIAAAIEDATETDKEREAEARAQARQNPNSIYLFGDFSVVDAGLLASSAYVVAQSDLPASVFEVATGLLL
jgi:hypothetical protein